LFAHPVDSTHNRLSAGFLTENVTHLCSHMQRTKNVSKQKFDKNEN